MVDKLSTSYCGKCGKVERKVTDVVKDPRKNAEGYADLTAYNDMKKVVREEDDADKRVFELVGVLKFIIRAAGFELTERIQLKDKRTGRVYR